MDGMNWLMTTAQPFNPDWLSLDTAAVMQAVLAA
jgi:hypothetical protein